MTDAPLDYELTVSEAHAWIEDMYASSEHEGSHGQVEMIPTMERFIWDVEGVYWSARRVLDDGRIAFAWVRPPTHIAACAESHDEPG